MDHKQLITRRYRTVYFSGTGNTLYVINELHRRLENAGHDVEMLAVDQLWADCGRKAGAKGDTAQVARRLNALLDGATDLILAYPTYASDVPLPLREVLPLLPTVEDVRLSVVSTFAVAAGDCCDLPAKSLVAKGYRNVLAAYVKMPNNFKLPPVNAPEILNGSELDHFYESSSEEIDAIFAHLEANETHIEGKTIGGHLLGIAQRGAEHFMHGAIAHHLFATANCRGCRLCAVTCPMGNITFVRGYPEFGDDCCACLRCFHACPQAAVQVTDKTRDLEKYPRYGGFADWKPPRLRKITARHKSSARLPSATREETETVASVTGK